MSLPAFELPSRLEAQSPPEARGLAREQVRLLVGWRARGRIAHHRFFELPELLEPGDLLVINVSATLPAALTARRANADRVRVNVSTRAPGLDPSHRVVELRSADGGRPVPGRTGERLALPGGASLELVAPYARGARLHLARFSGLSAQADPVIAYLAEHGEPVRYGYVEREWPLSAYQNVYATVPGSAEMPSAGRPFSRELLVTLLSRGVLVAPITLHAGVSSPERHEPPYPEEFEVPEPTARLVSGVRAAGRRVIAVGTTVVRALETAARAGVVAPARGWTNHVVRADDRLRAVDGLITGWHEPAASHLQMLSALAGADLLERCYAEALATGYLWHEFGDSHLLLP